MDATKALHLLTQLGLTITAIDGRLIVRPSELLDDDTRWLIRKHRDDLLTILDEPTWAWFVVFDGHALEVYNHPPTTHAEILRKYPAATKAVPLPESEWPHDPNKTEEC